MLRDCRNDYVYMENKLSKMYLKLDNPARW